MEGASGSCRRASCFCLVRQDRPPRTSLRAWREIALQCHDFSELIPLEAIVLCPGAYGQRCQDDVINRTVQHRFVACDESVIVTYDGAIYRAIGKVPYASCDRSS